MERALNVVMIFIWAKAIGLVLLFLFLFGLGEPKSRVRSTHKGEP